MRAQEKNLPCPCRGTVTPLWRWPMFITRPMSACCRKLSGRAEAALPGLEGKGVDTGGLRDNFGHAKRQAGQVRRWLLLGETIIPQQENVFPVFELHAR